MPKLIPHKMYTWKEIQAMKTSKGDLMKKAGLPETGVDFALPQSWVNYMSEKVDPQMLLSTTVMVYNEDNRHGVPVSVCEEVHLALNVVQ